MGGRRSDDEDFVSDVETDVEDGDFPEAGDTVDFGWQDGDDDKPLSGRRKKAMQAAKKKAKPGTFGRKFTSFSVFIFDENC